MFCARACAFCCVRDVLRCIAIVTVIVRARARVRVCVIAEIKKRNERLWVSQNPQKNINK